MIGTIGALLLTVSIGANPQRELATHVYHQDENPGMTYSEQRGRTTRAVTGSFDMGGHKGTVRAGSSRGKIRQLMIDSETPQGRVYFFDSYPGGTLDHGDITLGKGDDAETLRCSQNVELCRETYEGIVRMLLTSYEE